MLLGTQIAQLTGNDVDSGPALSYTLVLDGDAVGTFSVLRYGGRIALTGPLDYEQRSHYSLTLRASDTRHETEANLTVIVEDMNDNAPAFSQPFYQVLPTLTCEHACTRQRWLTCTSPAAALVPCLALLALWGTEITLRMDLSLSWSLSFWALSTSQHSSCCHCSVVRRLKPSTRHWDQQRKRSVPGYSNSSEVTQTRLCAMHVGWVPTGATFVQRWGRPWLALHWLTPAMAALASSRLSPSPAVQLQENGDSVHVKTRC